MSYKRYRRIASTLRQTQVSPPFIVVIPNQHILTVIANISNHAFTSLFYFGLNRSVSKRWSLDLLSKLSINPFS